MIGETILHYKILEKLGEGGMGVVYKAQDIKLNRTVALKFLPERVNKDKTAKERFLQEAQAVAALNHSNICTIYGIEQFNESVFMVMEFLEGGTLSDKLPYRKINDALKIAIEIGEALQEAHSKDIVHRDIKADNIMLTLKGEAKVMDFGLAKLKGALKLTRTSSTVGTLGYMAPEQIQGGEVDHRSDIFSFGVLLFEMLTGKLPFRGEHEAAIVYSVVNEEPETLQNYLPEASGELQHILNRALEKDPEDRYQSAADMVSELRRLLKHSTGERKKSMISPAIPNVSRASSADTKNHLSSSKLKLPAIGGAVGIILIGIISYFLFFNNSNSGSLTNLNPGMTINVLPIPFSQFSYPGLSKDGNWISFPAANANAAWDFYYMHVSGNEVRRVTSDSIGTGNNLNADISPDGSLIVYAKPNSILRSSDFGISIISSLGGQSKRIVQDGNLPRWKPDGLRIGYVRFGTLSQNQFYNLRSIKPDGSDDRLEYSDTLGNALAFSRYSYNWSPDGKSIVWIRSFEGEYQEVITRDLETGKERQLTFDKKNIDDVAWTKNGFIIFSSNRGGNTNLWIISAKGGTPQQLTKGSGPDIGLSVSEDAQKLVYLQQQQVGTVWLTDLSSSKSQQITFDDRQTDNLVFSPDGKQIVYTMGNIDPLKPGVDLYLQNLYDGNRRQLISKSAGIYSCSWSPDGNRIAFPMNNLKDPADSAKLYIIDIKNQGEAKQLTFGIKATWLNSKELIVTKVENRNGTLVPHDEIISIDGTTPPKRFEDSVMIVGTIPGNRLLLQDRHWSLNGLWTVSLPNYLDNQTRFMAKKILLPEGAPFAISSSYLYALDTRNALWKIDYNTGRKLLVNSSIQGLNFGMSSNGNTLLPGWDIATSICVNDAGGKLAFVSSRLSAKLVMIENIFR